MRPEHVTEFADFVAGAATRLYRTAFLMTGERTSAEDLVQIALERTFRKWATVQRMTTPEAYARRALINAATDVWRSHRSLRRRPREDVRRPSDFADEVAERQVLTGALAALSRRQRAVVVLRYFEDLSEADTARLLGCSVGSVKSQSSRALAHLRSALQPESPPESAALARGRKK
jgi:RNA polymerase sigma-70 factor (sigma-E family)